MKRPWLLAAAAALCGCVAYPQVYWRTLAGTARVDDGKPVLIKAELLKDCETIDGDTQATAKTVQTMTDAQGRYRLPVRGLVWRSKSLVGEASCDSRIQIYVCRDVCRPADQIDIDILGK